MREGHRPRIRDPGLLYKGAGTGDGKYHRRAAVVGQELGSSARWPLRDLRQWGPLCSDQGQEGKSGRSAPLHNVPMVCIPDGGRGSGPTALLTDIEGLDQRGREGTGQGVTPGQKAGALRIHSALQPCWAHPARLSLPGPGGHGGAAEGPLLPHVFLWTPGSPAP